MAEAPEQPARLHEKPFLAHLEDLRRTLIWSAGSLVAGVAIAAPMAPMIMRLLKRPLVGIVEDPDSFLRVLRVGDGFGVAMQVIFWAGLLIGLPGILVAICRFVYPGLTRRERRLVSGMMVVATLLFAVGVVIGYVTTIKLAVLWLLNVNDWLGIRYDFVELSDYCGFVLKLLIAFGLVFELPIIVLVLAEVGIIHGRAMREKRRHVIVGLMTVAMILTPPDAMSMIIMSVPLILLYEACIWIVWARERGHDRARA